MVILRVGLLAVLTLAGAAYIFERPPSIVQGGDFNAFYCAARALPTGADPYRYEPLRTCESRNVQPLTPRFVVPAPLPPYALALFAPLAQLSYRQATLAWSFILVAAAVVTVWAIVALTGLPMLVVGVCVLSAVLFQALNWGGLTPLPIALLCASAVAVVRSRWTSAAVLLGLACIEPHVALPSILASFVLVPPMRGRLLLVVGAIAVVSLAAGGVALNYEYLTAVLPAQALSEIGYSAQYGLSPVLHAIGYTDRAALLMGSVQYAAFALAGLWLARRMRHALPEALILAPMVLAVAGGTYVHLVQVAGASLPLAFVVAARSRWTLAWVGVALLAIPWHYAERTNAAILAGLVVFALTAYGRRIGALGAVLAGFGCVVAIWIFQAAEPTGHIVEVARISNSALAQVAWKTFADQVRPNAYTWVSHLPSYLGMASTLACALALTRPATSPAVRGAAPQHRWALSQLERD
jgi:hypothetical protein